MAHTLQKDTDKAEIEMREYAQTTDQDKADFALEGRREDDENSPEAILERYPLLRDMTPAELDKLNRRVRRRIDIWMLPMITFMLFINYLDRSNVTNARIAGMQKDLHMTDVQWSAGISLFYVGYMLTQLPGSLLLSKYKPRIILPLTMIAWSIPTICLPLATNAAGFMVCRFLVGFAEGPFYPGIALLTSSWYVKEELPFRMAIWQGAITLSAVFGGPFAASILETMGGIANLPSWKWFLLIEGAISTFVGVASYWFLPNWTNNTPWLTPEETEMAQYRIVKSAGGIDEMQGDYTLFQGAKLAAKDPFTWLFAALHFFLIVGQAYKEFLPSILHTFGESKLTTYLLQSPCYFLGYLATLGVGWSSGRFKEFTYHTAVPLVLSIVGVAMMISTENIGVRYTGICFLIMGTASGLNMQVSWETTVIPSPRHKKVSSTSHWFSPYFFLRNQEPLYRLAGGLLLVGCGASILSVLAVRWRVNRLNKVLDSQSDVENEQRRERGQADKSQAWRFPI